ncbi:hypothetical protein QCA50_017013 [Cerrena zonata]|uniref:Uncharacterized protein n=1 Tax=Cerrena zonata TaxID=2478898 RepID=A0AAW0FGG3_9APHY
MEWTTGFTSGLTPFFKFRHTGAFEVLVASCNGFGGDFFLTAAGVSVNSSEPSEEMYSASDTEAESSKSLIDHCIMNK